MVFLMENVDVYLGFSIRKSTKAEVASTNSVGVKRKTNFEVKKKNCDLRPYCGSETTNDGVSSLNDVVSPKTTRLTRLNF